MKIIMKLLQNIYNLCLPGRMLGVVSGLLLLLCACTDKTDTRADEQIIVRIADKVIKTREFLQRSEYAIRPPYCRGDSYIHKKIVLNSLIGEKLLALEAGEENHLVRNPDFLAYLEGRKEQAMRQVLYYEEFYKLAKPDAGEIRKEMEYSNRTYKVSYMTIANTEMLKNIEKRFTDTKVSLDEIYQNLTGDSAAPQREISWGVNEHPAVLSALFIDKPQKGNRLGPININNEKFIFLEVRGWVDRKIMTDTDYDKQYRTAYEKIKGQKAWISYKDYAAGLMRGMRLNFYEDTFREVINLVAPVYIKSATVKKQLFNNSFWQGNGSMDSLSDLPEKLENLDNSAFFSVDGRIWTVGRFRAYLKKHPLQFREERADEKNFAEQFKLAVVDLVRDYYITQDAYEKEYDESQIVRHETNMWRDHLLALFQKYNYLDSQKITEKDQLIAVEKYMTPYMEKLQEKYSERIQINTQKFEELQLTNLDMVVVQPDQPFPIVAPSFPLVTLSHRLDYGKSM